MNASRFSLRGLDTSSRPAFDQFPAEDAALVIAQMPRLAGQSRSRSEDVFDAALDVFPSERDLGDQRGRAIRQVAAHAPAMWSRVQRSARAVAQAGGRHVAPSLRRLRQLAQITVDDDFGFRRLVCAVAIAAQILVAAQLFVAPAVTISAPRRSAAGVAPQLDLEQSSRADLPPVRAAGLAPPSQVVTDRRLPATAPRLDSGAVQRVLNRYRDAQSTLDLPGVRAVWPSVDATALRDTFSRLAEQNLDYHGCEISGTDTRATAVCRGVTQARRVGSRRTITERHEWQFALRRVDSHWVIATVVSR